MYRKPYFVTYLNTGTFSIYLIPSVGTVMRKWWLRKSGGSSLRTGDKADETTALLAPQDLTQNVEAGAGAGAATPAEDDPQRPLTVRETAVLSSQFCILWFLANLFSNASLSFTSVGSQTILTSTSSFFTLVIGALCKVETITTPKVYALVNSIVGLMLITWNSEQATAVVSAEPSYVWLGNLMALLSAFIYGTYATLLKVRIGNFEHRINMYLFFGFVGLFNIILLWPVLLVLDRTGVEPFAWPANQYVWSVVLANAAISIVSDFCWALAMLMTTPLVVTAGLSATIPLAILGDMVINARYGSVHYYAGAVMMIVSIFVINRLENQAAALEDEAEARLHEEAQAQTAETS